jgi:hypothetical protein
MLWLPIFTFCVYPNRLAGSGLRRLCWPGEASSTPTPAEGSWSIASTAAELSPGMRDDSGWLSFDPSR